MSAALVPTRPCMSRKGRLHIQTVMKLLGIPVKPGAHFWLENEGELHYIHHDFREKSRQLKFDLHPDKGGDTQEYASMLDTFDVIERSFAMRGVGDTKVKPPSEIWLEAQKRATMMATTPGTRQHRVAKEAHARWEAKNPDKVKAKNARNWARRKEKKRLAAAA